MCLFPVTKWDSVLQKYKQKKQSNKNVSYKKII